MPLSVVQKQEVDKQMESRIVYFEKSGKENSDEVYRLAKQRAQELGIKTVVLASTTGTSAVKALPVFKGMKLIIVSYSYGFTQPDVHSFTEENMKLLKEKGVPVVTAAHAFGGICLALGQRKIPEASSTYVIGDLIAHTLRMFGQGMKVACESTAMAADAGAVRCDEEIIAIAGTGSGSDTAIVVTPANAHRLFEMRIREIICKPRKF